MGSDLRNPGRMALLAVLQTCVILALSVVPQSPRADVQQEFSARLVLPAVAGAHSLFWQNDRSKQQCFAARTSAILCQLSWHVQLRRLAQNRSPENSQPKDCAACFEAGRSPPVLLHFV